jgi:hypothetical protein
MKAPMHYSDVVAVAEAVVDSHIVVEERHYLVVGYANGDPSKLVLRRKFGHKVFLAEREAGRITRMVEV